MYDITMATALMIVVIAYALGFLIMLYIFYSNTEVFVGGRRFILFYFLTVVGVSLIIARGGLPVFLSVLLANTILIVARVLLMDAVLYYYDLKVKNTTTIMMITIFFISFIIFTYIVPSVSVRIILYSVSSFIIHLVIFYYLTVQSKEEKIQRDLLYVVNIVTSLYYLLRLFLVLFSKESFDSFFSYNLDAYMVSFDGIFSFMLIIGIVSKISTKKHEETKRVMSEYKALFDNAGMGFGYYNPDGTVKWFNDIASKNMGGEPGAFIGKHVSDLFSEEDAVVYIGRINETIAKGTSSIYEDEVDLPGGHFWFRSQYTCIHDDNNHLLGIEIISNDLTDIKLYEKRLSASEDNFKVLFEDAPLAYQSLDESGHFLTVNNTWLELLGYEREEVLGKWFGDYIDVAYKEHFRTNFPKFKYNGATCTSFNMVHKNGSLVTVQFNGRIGYHEDGSFRQTHCIMQDITMQKKMEEERTRNQSIIRNQQKLESIGTFAGGVAHEINNPVNGIMNYGQLILDSSGDSDIVEEFAEEILKETGRVTEIVSNLLHFSRQDSEKYQSADINSIINQTMSLIKTTIKHDQIQLVLSLGSELPKVYCQAQQIQQVIMNLVTNARDSLNDKFEGYNPGKIIEIATSSVTVESVDYIEICVKDYGAGIDEEIQSQVFDPFFTTKGRTKGTGLGLSISFAIIEEHKGVLQFDTHAGEFTSFHVRIPLDKRALKSQDI